MRFGFSIPNFRGDASLATFDRVSRAAEEAGFDDLWLGDHIVLPKTKAIPHPYYPDRSWTGDIPVYDPFPVLGYLAGITDRIGLALGTLIVPYRNPVVTAKMVATLSVLSRGRIILGIGAGWLAEEFEALNVPFGERGRLTDEYLDLMKALWADEEAAFHGPTYTYPEGMWFEPRPVRPVPIWVGGNSEAALRRTARIGDAWYGVAVTPDGVVATRNRLAELLDANGRAPEDIDYSVRIDTHIGEDAPAESLATGEPGRVAETIATYAAAGLTHYQMATSPLLSTDGILEQLYRFADEVLPLTNGASG